MKTLANIIYWAGIVICVLVFGGVAAGALTVAFLKFQRTDLIIMGTTVAVTVVMLVLMCVWTWAKIERKKS